MHWEIFGSYTYQLVSRLKRVRSFPGSWGLAFPCELERKKVTSCVVPRSGLSFLMLLGD